MSAPKTTLTYRSRRKKMCAWGRTSETPLPAIEMAISNAARRRRRNEARRQLLGTPPTRGRREV